MKWRGYLTMKQIAVLGSTGSIGTQTLEVVRANEDMQIVTLAAGSNIDLLEKQIVEFTPQLELLYNNSFNMISWAPYIYLSLIHI